MDSQSRSRSIRYVPFSLQLPNVKLNGDRDLVLCEGDQLWMEIDLEATTGEGDIRDDTDESTTVNCVRLHIPYGYLGGPSRHKYFETALAIAQHLQWPAIDEQTGSALLAEPPGIQLGRGAAITIGISTTLIGLCFAALWAFTTFGGDFELPATFAWGMLGLAGVCFLIALTCLILRVRCP